MRIMIRSETLIAELMDAFYKPIWLNKDPSLCATLTKVIESPRALLTFKMSA